MTQPINLARLLTLQSYGADSPANSFIGGTPEGATGRSFGGQIMAQAAYATGLTVSEEHRMHSLHGYFMRPGDASKQTAFNVEEIFTGGTFATRRAQGYQGDVPIMSMIASHQRPTDGESFSDSFDLSTIAAPTEIPSLRDTYRHLSHLPAGADILTRPFDFRYVEGDVMQSVPKQQTTQHVWIKTIAALPESALLHRAALIYVSDYLFMEPALRGFGRSWLTPGMKCASLDFAVWFHSDFNVNEWLLYELHTVNAGHGRALTQGKFYNEQGVLVASAAQEVMLRLP
ncbi:thioesterase family protein [Canibacter sp. lx-72]|uniref:acyl-CoA thioesterase n=1 Tax=Canibacter zhuwentaonis TaxID=2837491 RepID=UPI001BDBEB4A|nr:acyl-CoA thioesterase domain-containing protein [Canibacter zhuwentaonis]MBT1018263.1 thioesterase family protein [Canibacter zhuwentaonis]